MTREARDEMPDPGDTGTASRQCWTDGRLRELAGRTRTSTKYGPKQKEVPAVSIPSPRSIAPAERLRPTRPRTIHRCTSGHAWSEFSKRRQLALHPS